MLKFFKQFVVYGLTGILSKVAAVFLIPVYTNILSKEEYGAMALIVSCKGIIDLFSNLCIHTGIFREFYEDNINRKRLISTGFFSIVSISSVVFFLLFLFRNFILTDVLSLPIVYDNAFILMLLSVPFGGLLSYFSLLTRCQKKSTTYSVVTLSQLVIQISITILFVVKLRIGISGVFFGVLAGEIFANLVLYLINKSFFTFAFSFAMFKRALMFSVPILPAILAGWVDSSLGQILISKYASLAELGDYSLALQISGVFMLIATSVRLIWNPYIFENYNKPNFQIGVIKLYKFFFFIIYLIAINVSLFSNDIVLLLSNKNYINAAAYFVLLCFPMGLHIMVPIVESGVLISKKTKYLGFFTIIASSINLISMLIFLPLYGIWTVPVCLGFSRFLKFILLNNFSTKSIKLHLPNKYVFIFILLIIGVIYIVSLKLTLYLRLLIALVLSIIAVYLANREFNIIGFIKNRYISKNNKA